MYKTTFSKFGQIIKALLLILVKWNHDKSIESIIFMCKRYKFQVRTYIDIHNSIHVLFYCTVLVIVDLRELPQ